MLLKPRAALRISFEHYLWNPSVCVGMSHSRGVPNSNVSPRLVRRSGNIVRIPTRICCCEKEKKKTNPGRLFGKYRRGRDGKLYLTLAILATRELSDYCGMIHLCQQNIAFLIRDGWRNSQPMSEVSGIFFLSWNRFCEKWFWFGTVTVDVIENKHAIKICLA